MSAFDAVTLIYINLMISLADSQPVFIAKININSFYQQRRFYRQIKSYIIVSKSMPVSCIKYDLLIQCVTAPVSIDSQTFTLGF